MIEIINTTLGEVLEIKYGKDHKKLADGSIPLYGSGGLMRYVEKAIYDKPSIMIPRKGSLDNLFYEDTPFWTVDTLFWTKINEEKVDPKYLFYLLSLYNLSKYDEGSAVPSLTTKALNDVPISFPKNKNTQIEVRTIIEKLDQKITLLRQQNWDLEELAQTLFKRWFVDFEFPNENGEPYKSSGGKMVESELGEIPDGWRVGVITELFEVKDGTHDSPKQKIEGKKLITSKHLSSFRLNDDDAYLICEEDFNKINKRSKVEQFDILFSMIGTIGLTYFEQNETVEYAIKNIALLKTSQNKKWAIYSYLWLTSCLGKNFITANKSGSTQEYISLSSLRNIEFCIPSEFIINKFDEGLVFIFSKISNNANEVDTLTKFRDTLLPKLMRGELSVKK